MPATFPKYKNKVLNIKENAKTNQIHIPAIPPDTAIGILFIDRPNEVIMSWVKERFLLNFIVSLLSYSISVNSKYIPKHINKHPLIILATLIGINLEKVIPIIINIAVTMFDNIEIVTASLTDIKVFEAPYDIPNTILSKLLEMLNISAIIIFKLIPPLIY